MVSWNNFMKFKIIFVCIIMVVLYFIQQPYFFVWVDNRPLVMERANGELHFYTRFIHSVQKTPVEEYFTVIVDGTIRLDKTKYQSFGVGLPFLEEEGNFYREGDYFIFEDMNRSFKELSFRTGVDSQLTLYFNGHEYKLYELYKLGTKFDLFVVPLYKVMFKLYS